MEQQINEEINQLLEAADASDKGAVDKKVHQYASAAAAAMRVVGALKGDKSPYQHHYHLAAEHLYSELSNHPDVSPEIKKHARQKENEHYLERQAGKVLDSMKNENKRYSNPLIESTIEFVEKASRINGNLRNGVIKEETYFPKKHVDAGYNLLQKLHKVDGLHSDAKDYALKKHATSKLGYSNDKAENFANYVNAVDADRNLPNKD